MKSSSLEKYRKIEDKIIKDVRNLFRLKKEIGYTTTKDVRNLFRLKKNGWHDSQRYKNCF